MRKDFLVMNVGLLSTYENLESKRWHWHSLKSCVTEIKIKNTGMYIPHAI